MDAAEDPWTALDGEIDAFIDKWELRSDTRRRYHRGWASLEAWCAAEGIDITDQADCGEREILAWAAWRSGELGGQAGYATMRLELAGIAWHRRCLGLPEVSTADFLAGLAQERPARPRRIDPATPGVIRRLVAPAETPSIEGVAWRALLLVARAEMLDLEQLLPLTTSGVRPAGKGFRVDLCSVLGGRSGRKLLEGRQVMVLPADDAELCPAGALGRLVELVGEGPLFDSLFEGLRRPNRAESVSRQKVRARLLQTARRAGLSGDLYPYPFPDSGADDLRRLIARLDPRELRGALHCAYVLLGHAGPFSGRELEGMVLDDLEGVPGGFVVGVNRGSRGYQWVPIGPSVDPAVCPVTSLSRWLVARGDKPGPLLSQVQGRNVLTEKALQVQVGRKVIKHLAADRVEENLGTSSLERGWCVSQAEAGGTVLKIAACLPTHRLDTVERMMGHAGLVRREALTALAGLL